MVTIIPMNKKKLSGEVISYSLHTTGYGQAVIASTSIGVCYVGFGEREKVLNDLKKRYGGATVQEKYLPLHQHVLNHLEKGDASDLTLHVAGTGFQLSVWNALLQIPVGEVSSYKAVAQAIGKPKAVRAVGSAIGNNPVSCIIPCHRVVRSDGRLGGYFWGTEIKRSMLEREAQTAGIRY
jgi:AraC family transcriptional regulator of adaptative response/methylated-DNA-[protein]-cysteine methyltransferase